jgi:hypothetical protein
MQVFLYVGKPHFGMPPAKGAIALGRSWTLRNAILTLLDK